MLLAIEICTNQVFAWDLDEGNAGLEAVQDITLNLFYGQELPAVNIFKHVLQLKDVCNCYAPLTIL